MGFKFSLASMLRLRESLEKREELALQKVQLDAARVRRHIDQLTMDLISALDARDEALQNPTPALYVHGMQSEMAAAMEAKQNLSVTLQTLNEQRERQIVAYQSARSNRRMLTDLKEQQQAAWEQDQIRTQQRMLDDVFAAQTKRP